LIHFYKRDNGIMPPLIRRPAGLTGVQLGLGVSIGVIGGIYIWKPVFKKWANKDKPVEKEASSSE